MNHQDDLGFTALHVAGAVQNTQGIMLLLSRGASKTVRNNDNETPLQLTKKTVKETTAQFKKMGIPMNVGE